MAFCLLVYSSPVLPITLEAEIKEANTLIERLARVTPGTPAAEKVAMEIMHSYQSKKMLKSKEHKELGAVFHDLIYGPDGESGIARKILDKVKANLDTKYASLAPKLKSIRNKSSTATKKPPMDLDFGVLADNNDELNEILAEIKKNGGGVEDFHDVLQNELNKAFREVGDELGLPPSAINPRKALVVGTTGFHPEAYKHMGVIKGDTPLAKWAAQSSDVSRFKIDDLQELVEEGLFSAESAAQEAARGTVKDLEKLDQTFNSISKRTGKTPKLSKANRKLRTYLKELSEAQEAHQIQTILNQIDDLTGNKGVFNACNDLMDNMEAAWKLLATKSDPERLLKILIEDLLSADDYMKAMKALENGNFEDLPGSIQDLRETMFHLAANKRISLSNPTVDVLLRKLEGSLMLKDITGDTRQVLVDLLEQLDSSSDPKLFNMVFGESLGDSFAQINRLMSNKVKSSLIGRLASKVPLRTLDGKLTSLELGDGTSTLGADAFIGIAMAYVEINGVMDKQLPPDEERRELQKAVVTNMPIIGDILLGINNLVEAGYEGSWSKAAQSATYFVIGVAGFVPGFQLPALVTGLGMGGIQLGGLAWDAYWDRELVNTWIASGVWDDEENNGKLLYLRDNAKNKLEINFAALANKFNNPYLSGYYKMTIRDSIHFYAEHRILAGKKEIEAFQTALINLYPEMRLDEALRQPSNRGKGLIRAAIKLAGDTENIDRNLALAIYTKYKTAYDDAVIETIKFLKSQAEKEYQAQHHVGEALKTFQELEALGKRLGLPLVDRVNTQFRSFSSYVKESFTSPFIIDSLSRRNVQLAERYLAGYLQIEAHLAGIDKAFQMARIKMPGHKMTGYLEIDGPRISDLEMAYQNGALIPARKEAERAQRKFSGDESYQFRPQDAGLCELTLFRTLAGILVRRVEAVDRRLLLQQWTGKRSAAEASRDEALQELQIAMQDESVEISVNPLNFVATAWRGKEVREGLGQDVTVSSPTLRIWNYLGDSFESAYAWTNARWEGSQVYEDAIETQNQRIKRLDEEFAEASNTAVLDLRFCQAKLPELIVTFSVRHPTPGDRLFAEAKIIDGELPKDVKWQWQSRGEIELRDNGDMVAGLTAHGNGTVSVQLVLEDKVIARASADLSIRTEELDEPEDEPDQTDVAEEPNMDHEGEKAGEGEGDIDGGEVKDEEGLTAETEYPAKSPIKAPAKVVAGKVFTVSVEPSAKLKDKVRHYRWGGPRFASPDPNKKSYDGPSIKMLVHPKDAFPHEQNIKNGVVTYVDVKLLNDSGEELDESQAKIPVQLVSLGVELPEGYNGGAAAIGFGADKTGQDGNSGWQSYSARFTLHWMSSGESIPEGYDKALSVGEFRGRGKSEPLKYTHGSWGSGYVGCNAMQSLSGVVEKGGMRLKVTVVGSARGFWDCRNKDWVMSKGAAIFQEALALANAAARLTPYGTKLPQVDISSYAVASAKSTQSPPLQEEAGPFEVTGVPANPVYGSQAGISLRDKGKSPGFWKVLWQASEPGIEFDPPEGMNTRVTFGRMGKVMIWAQVLDPKDGSTVGEAAQVAAQVIAPKFTLKLNPNKPQVGEEIRAVISSSPGIPAELVNYKWSSPASSNRMEYNGPASEIGFNLKDTKSLTLKAEAVAPHYGDVIGVIEGSIQATLYAIKVTARKYGSPKLTWDPVKGGIVKAGPDVYLTGEEIRLTAVLEGTPKPGTVNWKWQVNEGVTISNSDSQTPIVSRSTAGSIQAGVVATDKDRIVLGRGSITLSVSEPVREPGAKDTGTTTATQVKNLLGEARKQADMGKMMAAENAVEQARRLDPRAAEPVARTVAAVAKKSGWKAAHQRDFPRAIRDLEVANRLNPVDEDTRDKLQKAERFAGMWPQVEAKAREFDQLLAGKKVWSAQKAMLQMQDLQFEMPGQMANPLSQRVMDDFNKALKAYNVFIAGKNSLNSQYFVEKNWQAMLENARQSQTRELSVADAKEAKSRIDFAQRMLREGQQGPNGVGKGGGTTTVDTGSRTTTADPGSGPNTTSSGKNSLTLEKTVFAPSEEIRLKFRSSSQLPKNSWVGLIPSDVEHGSTARNDQADTAWEHVDGRTSGGMVFQSPAKEGGYDLRMNETSHDNELVSISFTVQTPKTGASIVLQKSSFAPNENIILNFAASPLLSKKTWIGLIPSEVEHGSTARNDKADVAWKYVDGNEAGKMAFVAPVQEGSYDFRMSENINDREITSVSFTVSVPDKGALLVIPKSTFAPHEKVVLSFTASPLLAKQSWIGLIPSHVEHGSTARNDQADVAWKYLDSRSSGEMEFTVPAEKGSYDFRMSEPTNDKEIASISFTVGLADSTSSTAPASMPVRWSTNSGGYPDIGGEWIEGNNRVRIVQDGGSIVATSTYGSISWRMDGNITREGMFTAQLVHTKGVPSLATGYAQDRRLQLSEGGGRLEGTATFSGGGHPLVWTRLGGSTNSTGEASGEKGFGGNDQDVVGNGPKTNQRAEAFHFKETKIKISDSSNHPASYGCGKVEITGNSSVETRWSQTDSYTKASISYVSNHSWTHPPATFRPGEEVLSSQVVTVIIGKAGYDYALSASTTLRVDTNLGGPLFSGQSASAAGSFLNFPSNGKTIEKTVRWKVPTAKMLYLTFHAGSTGLCPRASITHVYQFKQGLD